jgi:hypothetical protein
VSRDRQLTEGHAAGVGTEQERVGQQRPSGVPAVCDRIGPDALDEVDDLEVVDGRDGVRAVVGRWLQLVAAREEQGLADDDRALGRLVAGDLLAGEQLDKPGMAEVIVRGDEGHAGRIRHGVASLPAVNAAVTRTVSSPDITRRHP